MLTKFSWFSAGLFLVSALLLTNCNDDKNSLGLDIQPPDDKLNVFSVDTATVIAYSQLVDSIKTDETSVSLLGSLVDPVFGKTTANFYTQLRLSQTAFDFGATPFPDSLVLALDYSKIYGDTNAAITVRIYELSEQINLDSSYFSNQTLVVNSILLGEKTFVPNLSDSLIVMNDTLPPHLRIRLSDLSSTLVDKLLFAPADSMASNASFLNYFYGLYVTAEPANSGGAIIYFDLMSSLSEMSLYYHNGTDDSLQFDYLINSNCARFGHFTHDYSIADPTFKSQVVDNDTLMGKNTCYVQALAGVRTHVRFPYIKNFYANGNIAVNEARFFLSCQETDPELDVATILIMVKRTEEGSYTILDDQLESAGYFGGYYDKGKHGYWFRITSSIQELMRSEDPDYGFDIYLSGGAVNAERVLLDGTNPQLPENAEDRMKLVVTYTTLN
jgi:hypothetical protein